MRPQPLSSSTSLTQSPAPSVHRIPELDPSARDPKSLRKLYYILHLSLEQYFLHHQVEKTLFVTLTFARDIRNSREAHRHLNSLNNAIRKRYGGYFWVLQLQHCGRIHYHLVIPAGFDCYTGTDLEAWSRKDRYTPAYKRASMNPALRAESAWWEANAASHGFGRIEVAPIWSTGERVSKYLLRRPTGVQLNFLQKRTRFWGCSKHMRAGTIKFSWVSAGAKLGRQRMAVWAAKFGCNSLEEVREHFGRHWGYMYFCDTEHARRVSSSSEQVVEPSLTSAGTAASQISPPVSSPCTVVLEKILPAEAQALRAKSSAPVPKELSGLGGHRPTKGGAGTDRVFEGRPGEALEEPIAEIMTADRDTRLSGQALGRHTHRGRPQTDVTATARPQLAMNTSPLIAKMPSLSAVQNKSKDLAS